MGGEGGGEGSNKEARALHCVRLSLLG